MQLPFEKQWLDLPAFIRSNSEIYSDVLFLSVRQGSLGVIPASHNWLVAKLGL